MVFVAEVGVLRGEGEDSARRLEIDGEPAAKSMPCSLWPWGTSTADDAAAHVAQEDAGAVAPGSLSPERRRRRRRSGRRLRSPGLPARSGSPLRFRRWAPRRARPTRRPRARRRRGSSEAIAIAASDEDRGPAPHRGRGPQAGAPTWLPKPSSSVPPLSNSFAKPRPSARITVDVAAVAAAAEEGDVLAVRRPRRDWCSRRCRSSRGGCGSTRGRACR